MYKQGNALHYSVKGRGEFPSDMLQYDEAKPASPYDEALIKRHADPYVRNLKEAEIKLVMPDAYRRLPNAERWASFGWEVVDMPATGEPEAARIERLRAVWDDLLKSLTPQQQEAMDHFRPKRII